MQTTEAEAYALLMQEAAITDVKSFTEASSRAAVAASAAATAVAVTKVPAIAPTDSAAVPRFQPGEPHQRLYKPLLAHAK